MDKFSRRTVKVTREHNEECRRLLGLMGIPFVVAPSEAEAQCAALARDGKVYAAGSEGVELRLFLTFEISYSWRPARHGHTDLPHTHSLSSSHIFRSEETTNIRDQPSKSLGRVGYGHEYGPSSSSSSLCVRFDTLTVVIWQFIDLCILLGCDYLEPIKGIGPKSALKLIREYKGLGGVVEHLREKYIIFFLFCSIRLLTLTQHTRMSEKAEKAAKNAKESEPESEADEDAEGEDGPSKPNKKKKKAVGTGGVHVPDEWPWEEAKEIFMKPDVLRGSDVEVCYS
jgi:flap endonuclease-1